MANDERKTFWQRLSEAYLENRKERITQQKVAALIGLTQGSGKRWAQGGLPSMEHTRELSKKLEVCVEWLYSGRGPRYPLSKQELELIELFRAMPSNEERLKLIGHLEYTKRTPLARSKDPGINISGNHPPQ